MEPEAPQRSLWRDSVAVAVAGQVERVFGVATALVMRLGLAPEYLGVYSGLRLLLDNTNRSSLGVGLGAVQEIPILRASGREAEAERVANVAFTANTITCAFYAAVLLVWAAFGSRAGPLGSEWTWGLAATGGLVLLKRYESFLTAILRSHGEFGVTARLDAFEAVVSLTFIGAGVWLAGFAGLLGAVALIVASKILFLHASHPLRFRYRWDWSIARRLMRVGLPIFANTATFGALISLDRMLILGCLPDGERAAGLYSAALLATNWGLDLAGRLAIVLYPHLQATLGRTGDTLAVARGGMRAVEHQAPLLFLGGAIAFAMGPEALGALLPNYREGLAAIGPLAPGMAWLGLAWPARQALTTLGRNRRLFLASAAGLLVCTVAGFTGATRGGLVGVASGMAIGYAGTFLAIDGAAFVTAFGLRAWVRHVGKVTLWFGYFAAGALAADTAAGGLGGLPARAAILGIWCLPLVAAWRPGGRALLGRVRFGSKSIRSS